MKESQMNRQEIERMLRRLFNGGELRRLPKSRKDTEALLALAASSLNPREKYTEAEVNELLSDWLYSFASKYTLDHVTIRRYLVDYSMLLRDEPGSWYMTNQAVINTLIEPEARSILPKDILEEVQRERDARKAAAR